MHKLTKGFYVGAFLAGSLGHWIVWAITTDLSSAFPEKDYIFRMPMMFASLLMFLSVVVTFILIYKMWAAIQGMGARISAGKALGFMFIPLFNLYWQFQVYWGWTKDYNKIAEQDDVELSRMPEDIALAVCVLPLASLCLVIATNIGLQASMLISLVNTILKAVLFSRICDGVNALVDAGLKPQKPEYVAPSEIEENKPHIV